MAGRRWELLPLISVGSATPPCGVQSLGQQLQPSTPPSQGQIPSSVLVWLPPAGTLLLQEDILSVLELPVGPVWVQVFAEPLVMSDNHIPVRPHTYR